MLFVGKELIDLLTISLILAEELCDFILHLSWQHLKFILELFKVFHLLIQLLLQPSHLFSHLIFLTLIFFPNRCNESFVLCAKSTFIVFMFFLKHSYHMCIIDSHSFNKVWVVPLRSTLTLDRVVRLLFVTCVLSCQESTPVLRFLKLNSQIIDKVLLRSNQLIFLSQIIVYLTVLFLNLVNVLLLVFSSICCKRQAVNLWLHVLSLPFKVVFETNNFVSVAISFTKVKRLKFIYVFTGEIIFLVLQSGRHCCCLVISWGLCCQMMRRWHCPVWIKGFVGKCRFQRLNIISSLVRTSGSVNV